MFGGISSGWYIHTRIKKIKKNLHILQQNPNLQSRLIKDQFALINLTRAELGDHRKLLHKWDLTLLWLQWRCIDKFTYLEKSRNLMVSDWHQC